MSAMRTRDAAKVARRETAMRGDWNACTLDDPSPDLTLCKGEIWASADGRSGRAGAFLADGLRAGWQGDLDTAISAFTRAVETDPRRADAYVNRGLAYQRKGDLDRALADLDRAVKRAPKAARGYYLRSLVLHERGDTDGAREDEERAAALDPAYAQRIEAGARN